MKGVKRTLILILLAFSLFGVAAGNAYDGHASQAVIAAEPCCDQDCADVPDCGPACDALLRCNASFSAILANSHLQTALGLDSISWSSRSVDLHSGLPPGGLKRPPRK
jgi:hypothetical protein